MFTFDKQSDATMSDKEFDKEFDKNFNKNETFHDVIVNDENDYESFKLYSKDYNFATKLNSDDTLKSKIIQRLEKF